MRTHARNRKRLQAIMRSPHPREVNIGLNSSAEHLGSRSQGAANEPVLIPEPFSARAIKKISRPARPVSPPLLKQARGSSDCCAGSAPDSCVSHARLRMRKKARPARDKKSADEALMREVALRMRALELPTLGVEPYPGGRSEGPRLRKSMPWMIAIGAWRCDTGRALGTGNSD